ncbi:ABC transporter permease [Geopsychrobacter electrodiphilus]|uniref:ABC transporter permease n=1 Tax=Geopsychrobacter electrodiphilus TaxID=225196 RepID=UPI0003631134|nr:FtsX-like permease family protein [Geopsychrobacter electrodiphilus]
MLLRLASRNLWRNRRRTLLTLSAMIVSLALLSLSLGVFSGMLVDILASTTEQYYGHIVISAEGYLDDHDMYNNFSADQPLLTKLAQDEAVIGVSERVRGFGLVSHADSSYPAELLGIRPAQEIHVTTLQQQLTQGSYLTEDDPNGAVLGAGLAQKLGVKPGDELIIVTQAADGSIGNDLLQVRGIFRTGNNGHDNSLVLVPQRWLQRLMALNGKIHEIALAVNDPLRAADQLKRISALLPAGLVATDWGKLLPEMREAIASFDVSRFIFVVILYFATGLGILNTVFMSVMERSREFGILMAIGLRPGQVRSLVLLESLLLGLLGASLGLALGLLLSLYMSRIGIDLSSWITPVTYAGGTIQPRLKAIFEQRNFIDPAYMLLIVSLLAGFLPARRAAKLLPVEALRED